MDPHLPDESRLPDHQGEPAMQILLLKSLLALPLVLLSLIGIYTMFEVFGRKEKRYDINRLKTVHRWNGYLFLILFLIISYLCIDLLVRFKMPLDPRTTFHVVFALAILLLLLVKISFIRTYKLFYPQAKGFGLTIALLAIMLTAISSGYYLVVTGFTSESDAPVNNAEANGTPAAEITPQLTIRTDPASIEQGRAIYQQQCIACHDPDSSEPRAGRGHRDLFRREKLPVSGRPATPENVIRQLREPVGTMPSFAWMDQEQLEELLAYLNTL
jgi:mono/diheme cytochrome c family protein